MITDASSCTQPEIVTVPETIVTVNAKDVVEGDECSSSVTTLSSSGGGLSSEEVQVQPVQQHRFDKVWAPYRMYFHDPEIEICR